MNFWPNLQRSFEDLHIALSAFGGEYQRTLKRKYKFEGVGLHNGKNCTVVVKPAPENTGIVINKEAANLENVTSTLCATTVNGVSTVEHLLAALYAQNIDNCQICVIGGEIPILDGSAKDFIFESVIQNEKAHILKAAHFFHRYKNSYIFVRPSKNFIIRVVFGNFCAEAQILPTIFKGTIAPSKTFVCEDDIPKLRNFGLIKGGSLENALVYPKDKPIDGSYHKMLDVLGDFSLVGCRLKGQFTFHNPTHTSNIHFAKELLKVSS